MNHIRATRILGGLRTGAATATRRTGGPVSRRTYAAEPAPPHPPSSPPPNPNALPKEPSRVGAYYTTFGSPLLKAFLAALFTYQITYFLWLKLEAIEAQHEKVAEIQDLQHELREALARQRENFGDTVDRVGEVVQREREELGMAVEAVVGEVREGVDEVGKATGVVGRVARGAWWAW